MINAISTAISGLNAASTQLSVSANNIANSSSTGSLEDTENAPYSAQDVQNTTTGTGSVETQIVTRDPGFIPSFSPNSPFANEEGMIGVPNVNLSEEIISSHVAKYAYQANAQMINASGEMFDTLIETFSKE